MARWIALGSAAFAIILAAYGWYALHALRTAVNDIAPTIAKVQPVLREAAPGSLVLSGRDTLAIVERMGGLKLPDELSGDSTIVFEGAQTQCSVGRWPAPSAFIGTVGEFGGSVRPTIIRLVRGTIQGSQRQPGRLVIRGTELRYNLITGSVADSAR